ncbi:MAG: DUF2892 domain-containing protein [Gammaproteobacteria bacterium]|nr:DUF2892 domain-containing protein [Gammaproteobacteria bacterium]
MLGLVVIVAGIYYESYWGAVAGVGIVLTAFIGWGPAYMPFGLSSCGEKSALLIVKVDSNVTG